MIKELLDPKTKKFIKDHLHDDPFTLSLKAKNFPNIPISIAAEQIQLRQKSKLKLPSWYHNLDVIFPTSIALEQCSSEATARFKSEVFSGLHLVDLTGGLGVDSFFFSSSFNHVTYVEKNAELYGIVKHNLKVLNGHNITLENNSAEEFISKKWTADVVYIDPSRRDQYNRKKFLWEDCSPNIIELAPSILKKTKTLLIKASPWLDITESIYRLQNVSYVYVISVNNECKEVIYQIDNHNLDPVSIQAVNINSDGTTEKFLFEKEREGLLKPKYGEVKTYLYEPNVSVLKSGAYSSIADGYKLSKLHPNTHLYTHDTTIMPTFPGAIYEVIQTVSYKKEKVQLYLEDNKAIIHPRNFPEDIQSIKRKLKITEGGNLHLFCIKDIQERYRCIIAKKIDGRERK